MERAATKASGGECGRESSAERRKAASRAGGLGTTAQAPFRRLPPETAERLGGVPGGPRDLGRQDPRRGLRCPIRSACLRPSSGSRECCFLARVTRQGGRHIFGLPSRLRSARHAVAEALELCDVRRSHPLVVNGRQHDSDFAVPTPNGHGLSLNRIDYRGQPLFRFRRGHKTHSNHRPSRPSRRIVPTLTPSSTPCGLVEVTLAGDREVDWRNAANRVLHGLPPVSAIAAWLQGRVAAACPHRLGHGAVTDEIEASYSKDASRFVVDWRRMVDGVGRL